MIINKSLCSGEVPNALKLTKVIPIFKSKDRKDIKNYRPISLLPAFSKIYEKVIFTRLYKYMSSKLYKRQFEFREKHSTIQAVVDFY